MAPLTIKVDGSSTLTRPAELGVMNIAVQAEGPEKDTVSVKVSSKFSDVNELFSRLCPKTETGVADANAPVTQYSTSMLRTWYRTPYNRDGEPLRKVHIASCSITATFRDFSEMNKVAGQLLRNEEVQIQSIDWVLTDTTLKSVSQESRKLAMRDAIQKAEDYAEVVGRQVVVCQISDGGYSGEARSRAHRHDVLAACASAGGRESPSLDLTPQDIKVEGSVSATFTS